MSNKITDLEQCETYKNSIAAKEDSSTDTKGRRGAKRKRDVRPYAGETAEENAIRKMYRISRKRERCGRYIALPSYCCRCTVTLYGGQTVSRYAYHFILFRKVYVYIFRFYCGPPQHSLDWYAMNLFRIPAETRKFMQLYRNNWHSDCYEYLPVKYNWTNLVHFQFSRVNVLNWI